MGEPSNHLHSTNLFGSIAWASNDIFAQVFGNEHNVHVQGVGFGPTPSRQTTKNTTTSAQIRIKERNNEMTQLKSQVTFLKKKMARYENLVE